MNGTEFVTSRLHAVVVVVAFGVFCACDSKPSGPQPIKECVDYANIVGTCLGAEVGGAARHQFDTPPSDEAARESLRARCVEQGQRLRKSCR